MGDRRSSVVRSSGEGAPAVCRLLDNCSKATLVRQLHEAAATYEREKKISALDQVPPESCSNSPPILYTILFLPLDQMPPLISACSLDCSKGISLPPMGSSTGGIAHGCDQAWVGGIEHWQRARQHQTQQPHLRREAKCSMKNLASPPTTGTFSPVSVRRIHTTDVSSW